MSIVIKSISDIREAKDGRKFYVLGAMDSEDPFASKITKRTVFQQFTEKSDPAKTMNDSNPQWIGGDPAIVTNLLKSQKPVKGDVVTKEVPAYEVGDRTATTYSTIVFATENWKTVFKNAGHNTEELASVEAVAETEEVEIV